ncbi:DUF4040 domain-containing protein [Macrococcoides canis]|uniref:hydrogen gas-evolving membrane-bound hydrogenase subunit E n=1 Tax=Macrococcoides canis TaxID=1855823 RepID=UPI00207CE806|nr:hydrogen gas-evolving membrane-bound hydrogenase subunit E [Macrococcus canis]MCO4096121.1 DUF4040 domain-containing protein [Macrococcus canis]UTH09267.1 DUF4040 domain-containing protein [Macrococcus canis]
MLFLIFLAGLLLLLFLQLLNPFIRKPIFGIIALCYPLVSLIIFLSSPERIENTYSWIPSAQLFISFKRDPISDLFFVLISVISIIVIFYSLFYMNTYKRHLYFYSSLLLFIFSMYGIVLANHLIVLYFFWELTSVASFLLIAFTNHRNASFEGALKSFIITVIGGSIMLVGFIILGAQYGTFQIDEILDAAHSADTLMLVALVFILFGAFTKSAQFPFHIWLPDAMEAPTPVSALLHSATMVKAGIYLLIKLMPLYYGYHSLSTVIIAVGITTMLMGSFVAITKHDLKGVLAYSTISQLGMMMTLIGVLTLNSTYVDEHVRTIGFTALIFLIVSHACYKATLFMGTGVIDLHMKTRDLRKLSGLRHTLPITFITMSISALAMAGVPFFSGYIAKEMFITTLYELKQEHILLMILLILAVIGSIGTFIYSFILIIRPFFGPITTQSIDFKTKWITLGQIILSICTLGLFFVPNVLRDITENIALHEIHPIKVWHGFNGPLFLTLFIFTIGAVILYHKYYTKLYGLFEMYNINLLYEGSGKVLKRISRYVIKRVTQGNLSTYIIYFLIFILIFTLPFTRSLLKLKATVDFTAPIYIYIISFIMMTSAMNILFVKNRMAAVVLVGVVGYGVSIFFMHLHAPDLALTQLVMETITTVLFLACFYYLPNLKQDMTPLPFKAIKHVIALSMSLFVGLLMIKSDSMNVFPTIADYYNDSYKLTGAKNIVNSILGDFRAFDTLLEGVVIMIVGLGIYTILRKGRVDERK